MAAELPEKGVDDGAAATDVRATDEHTSPLPPQGKDPRNRSSINDELYLVG